MSSRGWRWTPAGYRPVKQENYAGFMPNTEEWLPSAPIFFDNPAQDSPVELKPLARGRHQRYLLDTGERRAGHVGPGPTGSTHVLVRGERPEPPLDLPDGFHSLCGDCGARSHAQRCTGCPARAAEAAR